MWTADCPRWWCRLSQEDSAERTVVHLASETVVNPAIVCYLNRLSDHLFVLGRVLNDAGRADILWVPGANR
ncbi:MAG: hypothetical protein JOZ42_12130 [Acetobacteraceae bacterium]|nr:hypothetical protein [Acetobacteraceae bacterium]